MGNLKIEYLQISDLTPYANNPRINDGAVDAVAASIKEFGFKNPIVIDNCNVIIAGHTRLKAAKKLGLKTVPIIRADDLTEQQAQAFRLADNKTAELAEWDFDSLEQEFDELSQDFDMSDFGFELLDFDDDDTEITEDEVPEEVETRCQLGDVWKLGGHRLICGDSTDPAVIDRLMDGVKADIAVTSPPYGASKSAKIRDHYVKGADASESFYNEHEDNISEWNDLIRGSYDVISSYSEAQFINIQMLADNKRDLMRFVADNADQLIDIIVWDKKKAPPQMQRNVLNNQFEFVFVFGGQSRTIPFGNFHGNINNVIELTVGNNEYADIHRAVYPVAFPVEIMKIASDAETVIDPFGGTGTTLIACEQLNRKCYMCELDPHYCDVIIQRWENLTGKKAEKY